MGLFVLWFLSFIGHVGGNLAHLLLLLAILLGAAGLITGLVLVKAGMK